MPFIRGLLVATLILVGCGDDGGGGAADANGNAIDAAPSIDGAPGVDAGLIEYGDLSVAMTGMGPHSGQLMEFRVVSANDVLAARGLLDTLAPEGGNNAFTFLMPDSVPGDSNYRVDFYADLNGDRMYSTPPTDHAWRLAIPNDGNVVFPHGTNFQDIDIPAITEGQDFQIDFTGMDPHTGQLLELRVIDSVSLQAVGHYRLTTVAGGTFSLAIPGIIDNGNLYNIDFYADLNGNGMYDAPPTDHAWRATGVGTASGLTVAFAHNTTFTDIEF